MVDGLSILWLLEAADLSGTSFAARHLAAGMLRAGHKLSIFALRPGEISLDFERIGCPVNVFPHLGRMLIGKSALRASSALDIRLVHVQSPKSLARGRRFAKALRIPLVVTANRMDPDELERLAEYDGCGIVAVSEAIRERLANAHGVPQSRIRVIPNGLDLSRMPKPDFTEAPRLRGRVSVVGTLGQLAEQKGQRVFLQAVRALIDRGIDAEYVILGDGPDRQALRSLAEELGISKRVTFTPQTVSGQLTQLDVLVEPSLREGLGLSVMQAMAMGVPVVGTGVGGLYSLIEDGKTGLMVKANDPLGLADAIERILSDPVGRNEMRRQARELVEREFDAELVAEKLARYYRECLEADF
ncbi:MAG: glycosyltransferase family 4 protein [Planctomycetota bacterium]|jgi:glycosyltransferase involved in cell wall biosynthesis|nr:glycosyltransferase family 4 protein [Planctomycetota bacterium]